MPVLFRDFETRSTLHLPDVGTWKYAGHETTDVWCVSYAVDDGPVQTWTPGQPRPQEFQIAAADPAWLIVAHNDRFESAIEERLLGPRYGWPNVPIERHRCTQAMALAAALPAKLETVAAALQLPIGKDTEGARLMREMARPREPRAGEDPRGTYWVNDPEKLRRLIAYNVRDVEIERELYRRLPPLSDEEQQLWQLDSNINRRGFHVDVPLAEAADKIVRERRSVINRELTELTGGRITSIAQVNRIADYLKERGHKIAGVGKRSVAAVLANNPAADVERLLRLRQEGGKSSAGKIDSLLAMANDNRIHGALKFHGASTGRWSGHGFQPHNLSRAQPTDADAAIAAVMSRDLDRVAAIGPPLAVIRSLSRAMICAAPHKALISADYSSIEPRVLCWLAGETWKLDAFRKFDATGDLALENYCVVASRVLGRHVTPADEEGRQIGKYMELASGYGGALGAFRRIAPDADFTDTQVETFKRQWRAAHPKIVKFWGELHRPLLRTVRTRKPARIKNFRAEMRGGYLYLYLPSGRAISYPEARIEQGQYEGHIIYKDNAKGKWRDVRGWHGTFAENVVQAISRDLLTAAMQRLEAAGYSIVLHVHDEIVAEVSEDFGSLDEFARLMTELPPWAEGLPVVAKASRRQRYAKNKNEEAADDNPDDELLDELLDADDIEAAPVTKADLDDINAGLQRDGIEPIGAAAPWEACAQAFTGAELPPLGTNAPPPDPGSGNGRAGNGYDADDDYSAGEERTGRPLERYVYTNEQGELHQRKIRSSTKKFWQETWKDGRWVKGAPEIKYLYKIRELLVAAPAVPIWIAEGEKDANTLAELELVAVTNPGGAGKWDKDFTPEQTERWFKGRKTAYLLEDNDAPGRKHVEIVGRALHHLVTDIRIVSFRELPEKGDVTDWLVDLSHTEAELLARAAAAPKYLPPALQSVCAADVTMTAVDWLWPNRFAIGKLGIIAGLPDEGKGLLISYIAAQATNGGAWPCSEGIAHRGKVILFTAEDDPSDTVVPRLAAAGANLACIAIVSMVREAGKDRMFSLQTDLEMLRRKIDEVGSVVLVLIDPISAYLGVGKVDSYRTTDVRAVLGPVVSLAAELKLAIIGIMHFNKKIDVTNALLRISDSLAYGATARHVYGVVNDPDNKRKLMVRAKNNLAVSSADQALAFSFSSREVGIDPNSGKTIVPPYVVFESQHVDVTAAEAMQSASENRSPGARDEAKKFLLAILASGPVAKTEIEEAAKAEGISERTLYRAKRELKNVAAKKDAADGGWTWQLCYEAEIKL